MRVRISKSFHWQAIDPTELVLSLCSGVRLAIAVKCYSHSAFIPIMDPVLVESLSSVASGSQQQ